jgi:predicted transcriptional regulator
MDPMEEEFSGKLSPLELEIMQVLWRFESASIEEVGDALSERCQIDSENTLDFGKRSSDPLRFYQ